MNKMPTIKVTLLVEEHKCTSTSRILTTMATQAWVADKAVPLLRKTPNMGAKDMQIHLQDEYNVTIAYDTVWRGRERALNELYGGWDESFQLLFNWKAEIEKRSPGSVVEIDTKIVDEKVYFHRFFCALKPCINGFAAGCRPYISIDSTSLNGRWNGKLAAAIGVDGHNWIYPIAFGLIAVENEDNWTWFMAQLQKAIGSPAQLAICTDACPGLLTAVKSVFPHADQRECFWHLMQNFKKHFHGDGDGFMWPAARAYRSDVFDKIMSTIVRICPDVFDYLEEHHKLHWMRCAFNPAIKCDFITNNLSESFNNWIRDIKDLPVVELVDKVREMIMTLWEKRRKISERLQGRILPEIKRQLHARTRGLGHLKVVKSNDWSAEVKDYKNNERHVVKIAAHECTCCEWQQRKLRFKSCLETGGSGKKKKTMIRGPVTCKRCGEKGHRQASYKCPLNGTKKRPPRKQRKNVTKARPTEPSTPQKSINPDNIILDSPGMLTRRRLAMLRGEGSSTQDVSAGTASPCATNTCSVQITQRTAKKMTPKKRKRS